MPRNYHGARVPPSAPTRLGEQAAMSLRRYQIVPGPKKEFFEEPSLDLNRVGRGYLPAINRRPKYTAPEVGGGIGD